MSLSVIGQRCLSEREPELGLGIVFSVDGGRVGIDFPASGERRLYAADTPVLKHVQFREGETVSTQLGEVIVIESVEEEDGLLVYVGGGRRVREDAISDSTSMSAPRERLMSGQVDPGEVFDLRRRALDAQWRTRKLDVRGFLGGRLELIPHQFYILHEVASRQVPRVLLADEVGLGKTIEACLILQRLLRVGRARRVLVLVPESLTHQWFVELLRRFNLWFSIFDEERCAAATATDPDANPFLDEQLVLCSVSFLAENEERRDQAVSAGWDITVVDEAHHLEWSPEGASVEYETIEALAKVSPGLLLLTATPTQLGLEGHFARLRLLDPDRYSDYESFQKEAEDFGAVAEVAGKIIEKEPLDSADHESLKRIFNKDPEGLDKHLQALANNEPDARDKLIAALLDEHGTGRVVFRNTRASMTGFPERRLCPAPLKDVGETIINRVAHEIEAEEGVSDATVRYSFKDDPRVAWLLAFLEENKTAKVLLICKTQRKVLALESALEEMTGAKVALFHEGLPLVKRDRNAAWFAEADGAQLLICSEIGSEGRNFQFAHHLVLFDLPLNPGLLEQRIGRLDRIGQTETINIHVPCIENSAEQYILDWYHRGLNAFECPLHGGAEYQTHFRERLLSLALALGGGSKKSNPVKWEAFIKETATFHEELTLKLKKGRDRLLELNSFDNEIAESVIERVREVSADPFLRAFLIELLDHFGVRIVEHEEGDIFIDPSHAYVEAFPSVPREGMLATFDRQRAIAREDIVFLSLDHPVFRDALDLFINSTAGTTSFGFIEADAPNILLEAGFVLEAVADSRWHVEQFLSPTPLRIVVDVRGNDLTAARGEDELANEIEDADIHRFLERPGFNAELLKTMIHGARELAENRAASLKETAESEADRKLSAEVQRLIDLRKINDHVRPEEINIAREQLRCTTDAIHKARLRLDSIRLVVEGPENPSNW